MSYLTAQIGLGRVHQPPVVVTSATWTLLPMPLLDYYQLIFEHDTASKTAILTIWGSPDSAGAAYHPILRADTFAKARTVTLDVGTALIAGNYSDSIVIARGPSMYIYIQVDTAPDAGVQGTNYFYKLGGLA